MPVEHEVDVITQGDDGDRFYVVLKGTLNVRKAYLAKVPRFQDLDMNKKDAQIYRWLLALLNNYKDVFWKKIPYQ